MNWWLERKINAEVCLEMISKGVNINGTTFYDFYKIYIIKGFIKFE